MSAPNLPEQFDTAHRVLSAAIREGNQKGALLAHRRLVRIRDQADSAGIDTEEDGGWMVPSEESITQRVQAVRK